MTAGAVIVTWNSAAHIGACIDALHRHNGTTRLDMPLLPEKVWRQIHGLSPRD